MKKIFNFVLSLGIVFASFSPVFADSSTFVEYTSLYCFPYTYNERDFSFSLNNDARLVQMVSGTRKRIYMVSLSSFRLGLHSNNSCTYPTNYSSYNKTVNNTVYYYSYATGYNLDLPEYEIQNLGGGSSDDNEALTAIYYTYGEGAIAPDPDPTWGNPSNVSYSSKIAGKGNAAGENIDRITWDSIRDTNGNELPTAARVQVRAIPGKYTGTDRLDLMSKTYSDLVLNYTDALQLADLTASRGFYETKWSEVVSHFSNQIGLPFSPFGYVVEGDSYWYADGWVYEVRLQIDDYYSDWVKVYSATAAGPEVSDQIGNSSSLDVTLINNINTINQLNGVTENWYINNTTINMQPYEEPEEGDKPWWAYLLEAILSLVDSVVDGISSVITHIVDAVSDIIQGILDLFTFDSFTINNYDQQVQDIKDNSGIFGQSLNFVESLQDTFTGAQYAEPVLHYDGITIDQVQIIPAVDVNLNDYVEELGFENFRSVAYMVTDGTIFLSLILLVSHKLTNFLRR